MVELLNSSDHSLNHFVRVPGAPISAKEFQDFWPERSLIMSKINKPQTTVGSELMLEQVVNPVFLKLPQFLDVYGMHIATFELVREIINREQNEHRQSWFQLRLMKASFDTITEHIIDKDSDPSRPIIHKNYRDFYKDIYRSYLILEDRMIETNATFSDLPTTLVNLTNAAALRFPEVKYLQQINMYRFSIDPSYINNHVKNYYEGLKA